MFEDQSSSSGSSFLMRGDFERYSGGGGNVDLPERPITCGVRYCNYEAFMNRTTGDEGDYVIEALVTNSNLSDEIKSELATREAGVARRLPKNIEIAEPLNSTNEKFSDSQHLCRVRIRSRVILSQLSNMTKYDTLDRNDLVFCRPFAVFGYYFQDMKKVLIDWENHDNTTVLATREVTTSRETLMTSEVSGVPIETALRHMRCYVQFVEEKILPLHLQHLEPKLTRHRIRYEDIPLLLNPGALVHHRLTPREGQTTHQSALQLIYRVTHVLPMEHPHMDHEGWPKTACRLYFLDFDGEKMWPVWRTISFQYFSGERDVTELEVYPLNFHPNFEAILNKYKSAGKHFKQAISQGVQSLYYSGWTFVTGVMGEKLDDDKGDEIKYPEYIESEVIIDFKETMRTFPNWQTVSEPDHKLAWGVWKCSTSASELSLRTYGDDLNSGSWVQYRDTMLISEKQIYNQMVSRYLTEDFLIQDQADLTNYIWKEDDFALMPKRLFGYVLRERRFSRLNMENIQWDSNHSRATLENIEMAEENRKIIRSAVSSHFKAQHQEKALNMSTFTNLDAIRGKGKGLIILLHGAPGVGKTATAEAVAMESNRPLLPITCGDLGTKPEVVDKTLRDIFRYAHLWECILLFDEADVFLTQRERSNLERNALVGVFLRVMEYYRGILFLTTNRVGALDEAFRSRVHISLWYPHLTVERTIQVLRNNLQRLPQPPAKDGQPVDSLIKVMHDEIEDFIVKEYERYSKSVGKPRGPWNGRQIRNAVQVAACLALYQKDTENSDDNCPAILTAQHFQSVAQTTAEFEKFLKKTRVGDDSYWAQQRNDRADDWADADDYNEDDYEYEPLDHATLRLPKRPTRVAGPSSRYKGGLVPPKLTAPQSWARPSQQTPSQPLDYGDDRSDEYSYDDVVNDRRSSRRPVQYSGGGGRRGRASHLGYSGRSTGRQFPPGEEGVDEPRDSKLRDDGSGEWAAEGQSGPWRDPSSSLPSGRREARDDEARLVTPQRGNRDDGEYSTGHRQQWQ
ncbi:hypothetical protein F5Y14DRAFT_361099 [Nemania sp. NC0429]|nr:hypothetical protein F5Y14DRAFT_361099 [Nemania sp. NC0429]